MRALITKKPKDVHSLLYNTLEKLIENRIEDGAFTDEEEVKERYYFSTLEGLECLLIPFVNLPKNHFWEPLRNKHPKLKNIIIDDINFVLNFNRSELQSPKEHGYPYFTYGKDIPYWTSECSSFTLSVLANFLECQRRFGLTQGISKADVEKTIKLNYQWVQRCKRETRGWAWVYESDVHPWPTWSLLDTFDEILWHPSTKNVLNGLKTECEGIIDHILKEFNERYNSEWIKKVVKSKPYNVHTALDLTRLMLGISLYKPYRDIYPLACILFEWASKTDFSQIIYRHNLKEKHTYIYDASLIPTVFRALVTMANELGPKGVELLDEELGQNHEIVINRIYSKLIESLIKHGKFKCLWGVKDNSELTYELYFTERTIESLTIFLTYYRSTTPIATILHKKEKHEEEPTEKGRSELPNNIDKYTVWIPQLAKRNIPEDLHPHKGWPVEDIFEFYIYRLFNVALALDGVEWGYKERAKRVPDGRLRFPDTNKLCLYDAKSSSGSYNITVDEIRKFIEYAGEGKRKARASAREVQFFLIIADSFQGNLADRAVEFQDKANLKLVCMRAIDVCNFSDRVRKQTTNPSELQLIRWGRLLSKGNPLIELKAFEEIKEMWSKDLRSL